VKKQKSLSLHELNWLEHESVRENEGCSQKNRRLIQNISMNWRVPNSDSLGKNLKKYKHFILNDDREQKHELEDTFLEQKTFERYQKLEE
jgi:hypothetical protein